MKYYNIHQSGNDIFIKTDEIPENKIVLNKYEYDQTGLKLISDGTLPPRLYFAFRNPKLTQKYFVLKITENMELPLGTEVSANPGLYDMILIGTPDDYEIVDGDIDQSK